MLLENMVNAEMLPGKKNPQLSLPPTPPPQDSAKHFGVHPSGLFPVDQ